MGKIMMGNFVKYSKIRIVIFGCFLGYFACFDAFLPDFFCFVPIFEKISYCGQYRI